MTSPAGVIPYVDVDIHRGHRQSPRAASPQAASSRMRTVPLLMVVTLTFWLVVHLR